MCLLPDDSGKKENRPDSGDRLRSRDPKASGKIGGGKQRDDGAVINSGNFREYDITAGRYADEVPEIEKKAVRPADEALVPAPRDRSMTPTPDRQMQKSPRASGEALVPAPRDRSMMPAPDRQMRKSSRAAGEALNTGNKKESVEPFRRRSSSKTYGIPDSASGPASRSRAASGQARNAVQIAGYPEYDGSKTEDRNTSDETELDTGPDDFMVKFDFEGKYADIPEERPLRWRRERRTGCVGGILYSAFVICISILLASLAWLAASDVLGFGSEDVEVNMTVPKGFTLEDIVDLLFDAELIKYKFLFRLYAGYSSAEEKITAGSYVLNRNFDYRALVHGMTARGGARVETTVQIPEGYSMLQIFALLEENHVCTADELWRSATWYNFSRSFLPSLPRGNKNRFEGYLFPDTYNFYIDSTPEQAISKMLNEFNNKFTELYAERAETMGYSIHQIITIASMIEREAGNDEERPHIASVIYNRLNSKDFPLLQIDATIYYAIAGTGIPFSTDFDSPYNTYMYQGLPPGPIANPGLASIRAALYPASSKDFYYALNKSGSHDFFDTYAKHQAFVQSDDYGGR